MTPSEYLLPKGAAESFMHHLLAKGVEKSFMQHLLTKDAANRCTPRLGKSGLERDATHFLTKEAARVFSIPLDKRGLYTLFKGCTNLLPKRVRLTAWTH